MSPHNFFIISTINFSESSAASTRMRLYAKALANEKNRVYLLSCGSRKLSDDSFTEVEPNIFLLNNVNLTTNFFTTFSFLKRVEKFSKSNGVDSTFLLYPTAFIFLELLTVLYIKVYKGNHVFYELNELRKYASSYEAPLSFKRISYSLKKIIFKILFTLTQPLLCVYDGLICISTEIENYGRRFNKNTLRVPILTNPNAHFKLSSKSYCTKNRFNIGFSGSIHPVKEDLDNFIAIIAELKQNGHKLSFNLCGPIFKTYRNKFRRLSDQREELNYYGFLNEMEMSTFLSQQDLLVIPRGNTLQNKYGFSTKLSDYLNHQKIVLVTDISDNRFFIKDGINGFVVPPNNTEAMYQKLDYIIQNFDALEKKLLPNAIKLVNNDFNYRLFADPLRNFLKKGE